MNTFTDHQLKGAFSLRSEEGGQDVSEIAAMFGGGGHKHAAGFKLAGDELHRLESGC